MHCEHTVGRSCAERQRTLVHWQNVRVTSKRVPPPKFQSCHSLPDLWTDERPLHFVLRAVLQFRPLRWCQQKSKSLALAVGLLAHGKYVKMLWRFLKTMAPMERVLDTNRHPQMSQMEMEGIGIHTCSLCNTKKLICTRANTLAPVFQSWFDPWW